VALITVLSMAAACVSPWGPRRATRRQQQTERPNLLLVTLDTTRADHLGCYGYPFPTTPELDAYSRRAYIFPDAYSTAPDTVASHSSMMTSLYPFIHGARNAGFPLAQEHLTLAEVLKELGYTTAAFTSGFTLRQRICGLDQGFDVYLDFDHPPRKGHSHRFRDNRPAGETNRQVFQWLDNGLKEPFFLWVHYFDPHMTYSPPEPYSQMFPRGKYTGPLRKRIEFRGGSEPLGRLIELYDGEVRYMDRAFGEVLRALQDRGLARNTVIIVMADHGEGLGEHGVNADHGKTLYFMEIHVPFLFSGIRFPRRPTVVPGTVESLDLAPTALALLGQEAPERFHGENLLPHVIYRRERKRPPYAFSQNCFYKADQAPPLVSLITLERHLIGGTRRGTWRVYDRLRDPRERNGVSLRGEKLQGVLGSIDPSLSAGRELKRSRTAAETLSILAQMLGAPFIQVSDAHQLELSEEEEEALRGLGYIR